MVPLAYAASLDFLTSFDGADAGGTDFETIDGLAVNSTNYIIVSDRNSVGGDKVQIFDSAGTFIRVLQGGATFADPMDVAVNSTNFIIVGSIGGANHIVEIYDRGGFFVRALNGDNNDGVFTAMNGIAVNSTGHIFVADGTAIEIHDKGGFFLKSLTGSAFHGAGINFVTLVDIAIDSNDRLLVLDENPDAVQIFDGNEVFVKTFTGSTSGGGLSWSESTSLATDSSDRIYVADVGNDPEIVQVYDSSGSFLDSFFGEGANGTGESWGNQDDIRQIEIDSNGRILVVDASIDKVQIYEGFSTATPATSSSGSSDQQWKTKPTFGLDHNTFRPLVDGGFSFNGKSHDITDNWWTPFAEQKVKIGTTNTFTAKAYADKQLRIQEFLFGIPSIGEAHNAELGIEVVYDYSGEIEMINVVQKTDIIDIDSIKVIHTKSKCQSDDTVKRCDTTSLSMKFLEPLQDKIMALKGIDFKGRVHITYLNEGFDISGNSLNPMNTMMIPSTEKHEGLIEVTQTAKYSNFWTTQDDREFEMNTSGSFAQINQSFERHIDTGAFNRMHSEFANYKETQADLASSIMPAYYRTSINYEESFSEINNIFAYEYPETFDSKLDNPEIQNKMIIQAQKAQKIMEYLLDPMSYHK